jgi:hypothetical protein
MAQSQLTNEFKSEFALLLVVMKINFGTSGALNYSKTLYEWTLGAMITNGKIKREKDPKTGKLVLVDATEGSGHSAAFMEARAHYIAALMHVRSLPVAGVKQYIQQKILEDCFAIDELIFPIALSEGVLDLKDVVKSATSGMDTMSASVEQD